jgi:RNA polymerase-binding transcription factor DksA
MAQTADDYAAVLGASEGVLDDVERALTRLDEGTYGICEACGGPIDEERLDRFPTARTCAGHPQLTDPD